jgi:hypothetical protein
MMPPLLWLGYRMFWGVVVLPSWCREGLLVLILTRDPYPTPSTKDVLQARPYADVRDRLESPYCGFGKTCLTPA